MITAHCPYCGEAFEFSSDRDDFEGVLERIFDLDGLQITLSICPHDKGIVAVYVQDELGGQYYEPATWEF